MHTFFSEKACSEAACFEAAGVERPRVGSGWRRARQVLIAVVVASSLPTTSAVAEEKPAKAAKSSAKPNPNASMDRLREKLKGDEKQLIAQNLELTDAEAKAFWPLYDAYKQELEKVNLRIGGVINQYLGVQPEGPIPKDLAAALLTETLDIDKTEVEQKTAHLRKVEKVLPAAKMVRYAQMENKIRAILKYDLAAQIPMAK
jgi:hypothetical protein